ncbi:VENN motif pre-toxin domain-containing protein, partial [Kosakonia sp. YIM B13611]|uniref:VENN motif pre-toxin domain-containing protein n=1 Tax=unclassified Kosakonia TaxID=2632876 RepID=UPI0036743E1B
VQEQTGIFAGKGGFDVTVGNHTQLDGAVLASRADADKNRLDTGTLGFADINNKADFKTEHQGAGFSTSGSMVGNVLGNMANVMLAGMNGKGHAEGTTQSAVADGTIVIRDKAGQQQDVATLSRDTEHANGSIDPIFDKEKEQRRLQTAQMIGEIGTQVADIVRTEGAIAKERAKNDPAALQAAKETLAGLGKLNPTKDEIADQAGRTAEAQYGTGSTLQRGITAATAAIQALAGGDIKAALAGAAAPEIAYLIGQNVNDDAAKVIAHAVVNAALAAASGKNAATAAAGAATGELAGIIALDAWGIKDVSKLSEEQKQTVSALATLASGLAGALVGDSGANAIAGAQAGKTTVENNFLGTEEDHLHAVQKHGADVLSCSDAPASDSCKRGQAVNKAIILALGGGAVGAAAIAASPALVASAQAAAAACSANPVLCANQVSIWAAEAGMGDALPAGLGISLAAGKAVSPEALDKLAELSALMSIEKLTGQKVTKEAISTIVANSVEHTPLPVGYVEGGSVGAKFNSTGGLPEGYRRVVNSKTGITEILGSDGKLYLETSTGLVPKQGGNLSQLVEAESQISKANNSTTRFIDGVTVIDIRSGKTFEGTVDLEPTLERISSGGVFPHKNDGSIYKNKSGSLPEKPAGYYTEYVHPTPGIDGPGPQRIVVGKEGEMYYTPDHYETFILIKK